MVVPYANTLVECRTLLTQRLIGSLQRLFCHVIIQRVVRVHLLCTGKILEGFMGGLEVVLPTSKLLTCFFLLV